MFLRRKNRSYRAGVVGWDACAGGMVRECRRRNAGCKPGGEGAKDGGWEGVARSREERERGLGTGGPNLCAPAPLPENGR